MFTNALLSLGVLVVVVGPPDFSKFPVLNQSGGICPSGTMIEITDYDADANDPEAYYRVFSSQGLPIAVLDGKAKTVYVYKDKKAYGLDDARKLYPSPCDIPVAEGV